MIRSFAVGVPARNEEDRIVATIRSLDRAARSSPAPVHLVVTADRCRDHTHRLAHEALAASDGFASSEVRSGALGTAGSARHDACAAALRKAMADGNDPSSVWIATTDADTTVPEHWFKLHHAWSVKGAHGVAGLVELTTTDALSMRARRRWRARVEQGGTGLGHSHVHGANLGIRGDVWLAAGGFDDLAVGEDHELWRRARSLGASLIGTHDMVVRTSARTRGRTPGGLAGLLAELDLAEVDR